MHSEDLANFKETITSICNNILSLSEPYRNDILKFRNILTSNIEEFVRHQKKMQEEKGEELSTPELLAAFSKFETKSIEAPPKVTNTSND